MRRCNIQGWVPGMIMGTGAACKNWLWLQAGCGLNGEPWAQLHLGPGVLHSVKRNPPGVDMVPPRGPWAFYPYEYLLQELKRKPGPFSMTTVIQPDSKPNCWWCTWAQIPSRARGRVWPVVEGNQLIPLSVAIECGRGCLNKAINRWADDSAWSSALAPASLLTYPTTRWSRKWLV